MRVLPIDVQSSDWLCHLTEDSAVRLGFRYVDGLRQEAGIRIAAEPLPPRKFGGRARAAHPKVKFGDLDNDNIVVSKRSSVREFDRGTVWA